MRETHSIFGRSSVVCALLSLAICIISRILFDSPLEMLHIVKGVRLLPPLWVYNLLSYAWFFLIGLSAGAIIDKTTLRLNNGNNEIFAYRGGIYFVFSFFLSLILYHVFFILRMLFLSTVMSAICMICTFICAVTWHKVRPTTSSFIMFCFGVWNFYLFFVCLSVFLNN